MQQQIPPLPLFLYVYNQPLPYIQPNYPIQITEQHSQMPQQQFEQYYLAQLQQQQQQQQLQHHIPPPLAKTDSTQTLVSPSRQMTPRMLIPQHRELWRKISRMMTIEILRFRLQMLHNNKLFNLGNYVCRQLVVDHFTTIFYDYLPYEGFNAQMNHHRRRFGIWAQNIRGSDPLRTLTEEETVEIINAYRPNELPNSNSSAVFALINSYVKAFVTLRSQRCLSPRPMPDYADNIDSAANESLRKLFNYLVLTGIQMMNINDAFELKCAFPARLLNFLLNDFDHRILFIDLHLIDKMQLWCDKTHDFKLALQKPYKKCNTDSDDELLTVEQFLADKDDANNIYKTDLDYIISNNKNAVTLRENIKFYIKRELMYASVNDSYYRPHRPFAKTNDNVMEYLCGTHIFNYIFYKLPKNFRNTTYINDISAVEGLHEYQKFYGNHNAIGTTDFYNKNEEKTRLLSRWQLFAKPSSPRIFHPPKQKRQNSEDGLPVDATGFANGTWKTNSNNDNGSDVPPPLEA